MIKDDSSLFRIGVLLVALGVFACAVTASAQKETADPAANAAAAEPADAPQASAAEPDESNGPSEPNESTEGDDPPAEEPADDATEPEGAPTDAPPTTGQDGAAAAEDTAPAGSWVPTSLLVTLATLVIPVALGNYLARAWRMPEQAWRIATVLLALAVGGVCVATGTFKGGPDLSGGITLVYEIANDQSAPTPEAAPDEDAAEEDEADDGPQRVDIDKLIAALKRRIDPTGTKEVSIRNYGGAIEIIIPKAGPDDLQYIKKRITDLGQLEFRILADPRWNEDQPIIDKALALGPSEKLVELAGQPRAEWIEFGEDRTFPPSMVTRIANKRQEALVLVDRWNVTGEYLSRSQKSYGEVGMPIVLFTFNAKGGALFGKFTGENLPSPSGVERYLGIVLDKTLLSAPSLNERITRSGQITIGSGEDVEREVDYIVSILNAGSLPAALNKTPISEEQVSPTLGAETIEKGKFAIAVSLAAVLVFILFYYRFAGLVACLALAATLLLVLAAMVTLQAAFTLPGLAGLVLTIGMAVDANVLIFERMREEMKKGANLRTAIRNGFGKATTTIVDANVTTLIAAVVLYSVGKDAIKGFGVTLFLGIVMSMFTAIFCSRVVFDIGERKRWLKSLSFGSLLGETNIDFLGKRVPAIGLSLVLIAAGLFGVYSRGSNLLDIDFTGGSSVTFVLDEKTEFAAVNDTVRATELAEKNLVVVQRGETGTRYTVNSGIDDVQRVESIIAETYGEQLQTYQVALGEPEAYTEAGGSTGTLLPLTFNEGEGFGKDDGLTHDALQARVQQIAADLGDEGVLPQLENSEYVPGSSQRFKNWTLRVGLPEEKTVAIAEELQSQLSEEALFPLASKIGSRVAGDLQQSAIGAILLSLIGIVAYLWFRFQNPFYGLAAVVALVHDVLITLGAIALSAWVVSAVPPLAAALQIDAFQISLPIVAAFITIIGYSLNDTIVIFDRIREVRGKSPKLTAETVNKSINQTLSRTLLTSITTLIVVVILYFAGGAGIHAFAFALVVGVIVGTYSTIFIATPALLAMAGTDDDGAGAVADSPRAAA